MSFSETIFLFFLALIVFGPKKLPEIARQIGKALNEFRRASNEFKSQIEHEISNLEVEERAKKTAEAQANFPAVSSPPEGTAARTLAEATSGTAVGVEGGTSETPADSNSSNDAHAASETSNPSAEAMGTHEAVIEETYTPESHSQDAASPEAQTHGFESHEAKTDPPQTPEAVASSASQESHA
jgi:sec-independent protein translocase protein TatB